MAGGKSAALSSDLLKLVLNGTPIPGIADNAGTSPLTLLYISLHTADPGAGGSQITSEAGYPGYARRSLNRSSTDIIINGTTATLAAPLLFAACAGQASEIESWAAIGTAATGTGKILYRGPITPNITVSAGVAPQLTVGSALTEA